MQLCFLIPGRAHCSMWRRRFRQARASALRFQQRVVPVPVELHQLGATDETLTAERHQVGLRFAPASERAGPLLRTPDIVQLTARFDDTAVHIACDEW